MHERACTDCRTRPVDDRYRDLCRDCGRERDADEKLEREAEASLARIECVRASAVKPENVRWAWRGWVPLGMYSTLVGMPGFGKTTFAMLIAARITRGELEGDLLGEPSSVMFISYEDSLGARLRPLAEAAGADLDRLIFVKSAVTGEVIDLTTQLEDIEVKTVTYGARLLVVDPLVAGLPNGKIDSHRDQSVRSVLAPLMQLAEERDLALLTTGHFSKGAMSALMGSGGSVGFVGAPRSILAFGPDPRDDAAPHARVLSHAKCNVGMLQGSHEVAILPAVVGDGIETSVAYLGDICDVQADDLVRVNHREESPVVRAEKFVRDLLADGPHRAQEILDLAEDNGIAVRTLHRAKRDLDVDSFRQPDKGGKSVWWWALPEDGEEVGG